LDGSLGNGTMTASATPVTVQGLASGVVDVGAGLEHMCALTSGGSVLCWGGDRVLTFGDGNPEEQAFGQLVANSLTPVAVAGIPSAATAISSGEGAFAACAQTASGVYCWGNDGNGQLDDGTTQNTTTAVKTQNLDAQATNLGMGFAFGCANDDGHVVCWGGGALGQLGNGVLADSPSTVIVQGL